MKIVQINIRNSKTIILKIYREFAIQYFKNYATVESIKNITFGKICVL